MLRRLILGLVFGVVIGGALAFGLVKVGEGVFAGSGGDALAYLSSAVAGMLTGAVTGKPIWTSGAKVEAGLKALFGALLGAGAMFALRRWVTFAPDIAAIGGDGTLPVGELPMASLPIIAAGLGAFFGIDNTDEPKKDEAPRPRKRVGAPDARADAKARIAEPEDDDDEPAARRAKR